MSAAEAMLCWIDLPLPDHLGGKPLKETLRERGLEGKPLEEQLAILGGIYKPWKAKDFIPKLRQVNGQARDFLSALHTHSHDGVAKGRTVGLRTLALEHGYCKRTLQKWVAKLEKWVPGFEVDHRKNGRENVYRFTIEFLWAAGAILFPKPKPPQAGDGGNGVPSLTPTKNPNHWRLYMPNWLLKRQAATSAANVGQGPELPPGTTFKNTETREKRLRDEEESRLKRLREEAGRKGQRALESFDAQLAAFNLQRLTPRDD